MNLNVTTLLALFGWPVVAVWLYSTRPIGQATLWTILGGFLLLPVDAVIKFDMIPQLDKYTIPSFVALAACTLIKGRTIRFGNRFGLAEVLILGFLASPFITSALNSDPILVGRRVLPGAGIYDGISAAFNQFVVLIPFLLGRQFLRRAVDTEDIMRTLVGAGLAYSVPMLLEVRMSPQLHTWIYGYFPHDLFIQQIRDGGFRPVVFLGHGLPVAFFAMTALVAAAALWRAQTRIARLPCSGVAAYLSLVLFFCKSLGALSYGAVVAPLVRFATPRVQLRAAAALVMVALCYPLLRSSDLVPTQIMVAATQLISVDRAGSLESRFNNERQLLDRASQRLWFGWGRFGRARIYDNNGYDTDLPDGYWVITLGQFGLIGFVTTFGLLGLTVFRAAHALKFEVSSRDANFLAALALIIAIYIFNLVPNSDLFPWTWLLVGALLGRAEALGEAFRARRLSPRNPRLQVRTADT
jgi:hypothetical protein